MLQQYQQIIKESEREDLRDKYEVVIGLEVHAQLKTKSKIFAPDSTEFGNEQNTQISPITLGMRGVLPVLYGFSDTFEIGFCFS